MAWKLTATALALACLAGCGSAPSPTANQDVVATVGGQPISRELFDYYVRKQTGVSADKVDGALRQSLLTDLVRLKAAAIANAGHVEPNVAHELELQRLQILARAGATAAGVWQAPSDGDLQSAYRTFVASRPASEFHAAHILVATELHAIQVIHRLEHGENFADVAKQESADASKDHGGDIGWVYPGHLPDAFIAALEALKRGDYTRSPVKTPYGWHVIQLIDTRTAPVPEFDAVKAQLATSIQEERYKQFLRGAAARVGNEGKPST